MASRPMRRAAAELAGVCMLAVVAAVSLAFLHDRQAPSSTPRPEDGVILLHEEGLCVPADELPAEAEPLSTHNACHDCPKNIPGEGCTRVSCDPCCYRCAGDPILRCL